MKRAIIFVRREESNDLLQDYNEIFWRRHYRKFKTEKIAEALEIAGQYDEAIIVIYDDRQTYIVETNQLKTNGLLVVYWNVNNYKLIIDNKEVYYIHGEIDPSDLYTQLNGIAADHKILKSIPHHERPAKDDKTVVLVGVARDPFKTGDYGRVLEQAGYTVIVYWKFKKMLREIDPHEVIAVIIFAYGKEQSKPLDKFQGPLRNVIYCYLKDVDTLPSRNVKLFSVYQDPAGIVPLVDDLAKDFYPPTKNKE